MYSLGGFPHSSVGKESACVAGDLDSIPGLGRSPGEGNGKPLQYSSWGIPWKEEPGRLQSMGSQGQDMTQRLERDREYIGYHNGFSLLKDQNPQADILQIHGITISQLKLGD